MASVDLTMKDLKAQLAELSEKHPKLSSDELFVAWFFHAYITEDELAAAKAVAGGARDKSVDGVLIDHEAKTVFVVQAKLRGSIEAKTEDRSAVMAFAQLADVICTADHKEFAAFIASMDDYCAELLKEARQRVKQGYRLWLYYVTLGRVTPGVEHDASRLVGKAHPHAAMDILSGKRILLLLKDYLDGAAPPIPSIDLEMEAGEGVRVNGILQRYDDANEIESWVFSMKGNQIGEVYSRHGQRLFARNIRGYMGRTPINEGMAQTLESHPGNFFYYNNGITIVCDRAVKISQGGRDLLRVNNPQIINGQQTSRVLAQEGALSDRASVLVKVIQVPRNHGGETESFDDLVSAIVRGTNWQNAIKPSDLMSNDRKQIEIERALRKVGYNYLRKREKKGESKKRIGGKRSILIKKEDLAQAVAGCILDPVVARSGKDNLFKDEYYDRVFPHTAAEDYLSMYWLSREVTYIAKGYPQRGYMKWLVLGFVWKRLAPLVRANSGAVRFREHCERQKPELTAPLYRAIDVVYVAAARYYRRNRGVGDTQADPSLFFRSKRGRNREFEAFWKRLPRGKRDDFEAKWARLERVIRAG